MHVGRERPQDFGRQDFGRTPDGELSWLSLAAATAAIAVTAIALIVLIPRANATSAQIDEAAQLAAGP